MERWGIYRGVVTEANDPQQRGRLKVRIPGLLGDIEIWASACVPDPNQSAKTLKLPQPDTPVWIQFEGGDIDRPVWVGFPLE